MAGFVPAHLSEFPDAAKVADCVPATAIMVANKVTHNHFPSTIAEREALQARMPDPTPDPYPGTENEGATNEQAAAGLKSFLGLTIPTVADRSAILSALADSSKGLGVIGSYQALPSWIRQHGNQPTFDGLHDLYLGGLGDGKVIVGDPLGSSMGPIVDVPAVVDYVRSTAFAALVGTEQSATIVGYRAYVGPGPFTAYHVMRFTHLAYGPKTYPFAKQSWARVKHGAPGFWQFLDGYFQYLYAIFGRSPVFTVYAVYSDGTMRKVSAAS